jgi:hypothetical protein
MMRARSQARRTVERVSPDAVLAVAGHLFVLFGFVVAQPLFDIVGRNAEFLVAHHAAPGDIVALTAILSFVAPALLLAMIGLAWLIWQRLGGLLYRIILGALVSGFSVLLLRRISLPGLVVIVLGVIAGGAAAVVHARSAVVRGYLTVLAPCGFVFPILFLFFSPVSQLLTPQVEQRHFPRIDSGIPVVFIVFDEFPLVSLLDASSHIDPVRYPAFAALAANSYWFRDATTVAQSTTYAIPAMLTGRYPDKERLPTAAACPDNLFTLLGGGGYHLRVIEICTMLCPPELAVECAERPALWRRLGAQLSDLGIVYLHLLLPPDLAFGLPTISGTWRDFKQPARGQSTDDTTESYEDGDPRPTLATLVASFEPSSQATLYFAHIELPHVPWKFLPSGREYGPVEVFPHGIVRRHFWVDDEWLVTQAWQRHLLQVEYTDRALHEIMGRLKEVDLYDPALIVVTADHGVSFRPGDRRRQLTPTNVSDIINVPLLIKLPGQREGVISDRNVEVVDILPTIAEVLGMSEPWHVDGQSAIDFNLPDRRQKTVYRAEIHENAILGPSVREERDLALERKVRLFGERTPSDRLFQIGRYSDLVGRSLSDLVDPGLATAVGFTATLEHPSLLDDVDPRGDFVPAYLEGGIRAPEPLGAPIHLAVALNGRIAAVTRTFDHRGRNLRFAVLVPETALRRGRNLVEVAVIRTGDGTRTWLERVRLSLTPVPPSKAGPLFDDGLETGDTSMWGFATP